MKLLQGRAQVRESKEPLPLTSQHRKVKQTMENQQKKDWKSETGGNGEAQRPPRELWEERFQKMDGMSSPHVQL